MVSPHIWYQSADENQEKKDLHCSPSFVNDWWQTKGSPLEVTSLAKQRSIKHWQVEQHIKSLEAHTARTKSCRATPISRSKHILQVEAYTLSHPQYWISRSPYWPSSIKFPARKDRFTTVAFETALIRSLQSTVCQLDRTPIVAHSCLHFYHCQCQSIFFAK